MSHYLRARFRQIVGYPAERPDALDQSGQHYPHSIIASARAAGLRRPGTPPNSHGYVDLVTEEHDLVRNYDLEVNAFVVKPVVSNAFFEAIRDLMVFLAVLTEPPPHGARPAP